MNEKFKLVLEYLKYQGIVKGKFENIRSLVFTNEEFDNLVKSVSKVVIDLNNAVKSLKSKKNENEENDEGNRKIRFYETQSKFFCNLWFGLILLKIIDLYLLGSLSKDRFISLVKDVHIDNSIFYYNVAFLLFRKLYIEESTENLSFIKIVVEELLNVDVMNVCTHFNEDYFKIDYFDHFFYKFKFTSFLEEDFSDFDSRSLFYLNNKRVKDRYLNFINGASNKNIIYLQIYVMIMLRKLLVGFSGQYERKVAHYKYQLKSKHVFITKTL